MNLQNVIPEMTGRAFILRIGEDVIRRAASGQMKTWAEQMYSVIQLLLYFARVRSCGAGTDARFRLGGRRSQRQETAAQNST